jgi:hypothetical protein
VIEQEIENLFQQEKDFPSKSLAYKNSEEKYISITHSTKEESKLNKQVRMIQTHI